jgi:hypothetical protein
MASVTIAGFALAAFSVSSRAAALLTRRSRKHLPGVNVEPVGGRQPDATVRGLSRENDRRLDDLEI